MKKIVILVMIVLTCTLIQAQQMEVIYDNIESIDRHGKTLIKMADAQYENAEKRMNKYMENQDTYLDSIHHEQAVILYLNKFKKLNDDFSKYFETQKKIKVFKIDTEYYIKNDTLGLSLSERILVIQARLSRYETLYGVKQIQDNPKYKEYKKTLAMFLNFEQQLLNQ